MIQVSAHNNITCHFFIYLSLPITCNNCPQCNIDNYNMDNAVITRESLSCILCTMQCALCYYANTSSGHLSGIYQISQNTLSHIMIDILSHIVSHIFTYYVIYYITYIHILCHILCHILYHLYSHIMSHILPHIILCHIKVKDFFLEFLC